MFWQFCRRWVRTLDQVKKNIILKIVHVLIIAFSFIFYFILFYFINEVKF